MDEIICNLNKFASLALIQIIVVFSPGQDFALILKSSLLYSKKIAFFNVLGIICGASIHLLYNFIGIQVLQNNNNNLLEIIKVLGSLYLIFLGVNSIYLACKNNKNKKKFIIPYDTNGTRYKVSFFSSFCTGLFTNLLNPKAILFFISFFTSFIDYNTSKFIVTLLCFEILIIAFICFLVIIFIFSSDKVKNVFAKYSNYIELIIGFIFICLGCKLLLTKFK